MEYDIFDDTRNKKPIKTKEAFAIEQKPSYRDDGTLEREKFDNIRLQRIANRSHLESRQMANFVVQVSQSLVLPSS